MTSNRQIRRRERKLTEALVRAVKPGARFLQWRDFERMEPDAAADLRLHLWECGARENDAVIYRHGEELHVMFPPEFA